MKVDWTALVIALMAGTASAATVVWAAGVTEGTNQTRLKVVEAHATDSNIHMTSELHRRLGRIEGYLDGIANRLGVDPPE
jgi:hypothetical protein